MQFGAELRVLITIETSSFEDKEALKTQLGLKGIKAGPADVSAEVKVEVSELLANKAVRVSAQADAFGFSTQRSLAAIESDPLAAAAGLVEAMKVDLSASIQEDQCNDGGGCDGARAVGYRDNGRRAARAVAVEKRAYRSAANFPRDDASIEAFIEHDNQVALALSVVEEHARVYTTVASVYNEEVNAIRESETPYNFAVYARNVFEELATQEGRLLDYAQEQAEAFDLEHGTAARAIAESLNSCWDYAVQGDFGRCQPRAELAAVYEILDDYADKRIRPIYYTVGAETEEWQDATCPRGVFEL